jgi:PAS domain S-box-containing protein
VASVPEDVVPVVQVVPGIDFESVFDAIPTPYLVLDRDLRIVAVNRARELITGRGREDVVGQALFDAFPDDPDDPDADGVTNLRASLNRVLNSARAESMPLQRYDIPAEGGGFLPRWWTPVNTPVLDSAGNVELILHRVDDVTAYVEEHLRDDPDADPGAAPITPPAIGSVLRAARVNLTRTQDDLQVSQQQLQSAREAEAISQRLAALVDVAQALGRTETETDVLSVVAGRGLALFGASAPALCLLEPPGGGVRTLTLEQVPAGVRTQLQQLPADHPLPLVDCAVSGTTHFFTDLQQTVTHFPAAGPICTVLGVQGQGSVPLRVREHLLGSLSLGFTHPRQWPQTDRDLLLAFASLTAQALARITSHDAEVAANAEVARFSETLQRSLLTSPPEPNHLHIAVRYSPATRDAEVGGDWYDAFITADGTTCLVIGDVTGHDRFAAAAMGQLRNLLRGIGYAIGDPPAAILGILDHAIHDLGVDTTATLILARIEQTPEQRRVGARLLCWSNAGHLPPLLIDPDGTARYLEAAEDLMLGVDPGTTRHDHQVLLEPGSTLLLYTDGLIERRHATLEDGLEWLRTTVTDLVTSPVDDLCQALLIRIGDQVADDVALLAVRAYPEDSPRPAEAGPDVDPRREPTLAARPRPGAHGIDVATDTAMSTNVEEAEHGGGQDDVRSDTLVLDPDPAAVRQARIFVHDHCCQMPECGDICDTLTLLVSEIVTNAISHGRSRARLRVSTTSNAVRVEVSDDDSRLPVLTPADPDALGGRGLAMVDLLATAWGVREEDVGKTVWLELHAS